MSNFYKFCPDCNGAGFRIETKYYACLECRGCGRVDSQICSKCYGRGQVSIDSGRIYCFTCRGTGGV